MDRKLLITALILGSALIATGAANAAQLAPISSWSVTLPNGHTLYHGSYTITFDAADIVKDSTFESRIQTATATAVSGVWFSITGDSGCIPFPWPWPWPKPIQGTKLLQIELNVSSAHGAGIVIATVPNKDLIRSNTLYKLDIQTEISDGL